jgi:hypothetical protein
VLPISLVVGEHVSFHLGKIMKLKLKFLYVITNGQSYEKLVQDVWYLSSKHLEFSIGTSLGNEYATR